MSSCRSAHGSCDACHTSCGGHVRPCRYMAVSTSCCEDLQKVALKVFGAADSGPRVQAALLIRAMAMLLPAPALDNALKVGFCCDTLCLIARPIPATCRPARASMSSDSQTMASHSAGRVSDRSFRMLSSSTRPACRTSCFMGACACWSCTAWTRTTAYSHAFTHIKELAMLLRSGSGVQVCGRFPRCVLLADHQLPRAMGSAAWASHADKQVMMGPNHRLSCAMTNPDRVPYQR